MPTPPTFVVRTGALNVQKMYDTMGEPVLIEISLGHERPATDPESAVLTDCAPPLQTG
jgi:hypothetical protein